MKAINEAYAQHATERECRTAPIVWVLWLLVLAMLPVDTRAELFGLPSGNALPALKIEGHNSPSWYANAGFHTFKGVKIDSIFGFGGGLVLPLSDVEAYVGLDIIEETIVGIGVRYALR